MRQLYTSYNRIGNNLHDVKIYISVYYKSHKSLYVFQFVFWFDICITFSRLHKTFSLPSAQVVTI